MSVDLGFSDRAYGLGVGMFFLGYVIFELPASPPKATKRRSCSCSFTNASAALSLTACSTHRRPPNSNPRPGSRRPIAKQTNPSTRSTIACRLNYERRILRSKAQEQLITLIGAYATFRWLEDTPSTCLTGHRRDQGRAWPDTIHSWSKSFLSL